MKHHLSGIVGAVLALGLAAFFAGCVSGNKAVPSTVITWDIVNGKATITAPKQAKIGNLEITRSGTNVHVVLQGAEFINDPDVIQQSYAGQAAMLREGLNIGVSAVQTGIAIGTGLKPQTTSTNR